MYVSPFKSIKLFRSRVTFVQMYRKFQKRSLLLIVIMFCRMFVMHAFAQTELLTNHLWYNEEKTSKIQLYKATDGKYYGKIVWLKVSQEEGKPRTDSHNPDKAKQKDPLFGLLILTGFKKETEMQYVDGNIYDPKNGKTYRCKINYVDGHLNVRGYIGFSLIGRTTIWTNADL